MEKNGRKKIASNFLGRTDGKLNYNLRYILAHWAGQEIPGGFSAGPLPVTPYLAVPFIRLNMCSCWFILAQQIKRFGKSKLFCRELPVSSGPSSVLTDNCSSQDKVNTW